MLILNNLIIIYYYSYNIQTSTIITSHKIPLSTAQMTPSHHTLAPTSPTHHEHVAHLWIRVHLIKPNQYPTSDHTYLQYQPNEITPLTNSISKLPRDTCTNNIYAY